MEDEGKGIVIFAPSYDDNTQIARRYAEYVIDSINSLGVRLTVLLGSDATTQKLRTALDNPDVVGLDVYSHGEEYGFFNQDTAPVELLPSSVTGANPVSAVRGKGIEVLACRTAQGLGRRCVDAGGADFYIGYVDLLYAPDSDEDRAVLTTAKRLLYQGATATEAVEAQRQAMVARRTQFRDMRLRHLVLLYGQNLRSIDLLGNGAGRWLQRAG